MYSIPTILTAQELLDKAFHKAAKIQAKGPNPFIRTRMLALSKIDSITHVIDHTLNRYIKAFPSFDRIPLFFSELIDSMIGVDTLKKHLGTLDWGRKQVQNLSKTTKVAIRRTRAQSYVTQKRQEFYGRTSSLLHQIGPALEFLNDARNRLRKLPNIDPELPTIVIAGYPNVGKSLLVKKISSAKPLIATYPFTTKAIKLGHFTHRRKKYQVIDTPGLLDRPLEKRNNIERQAILALRYLSTVIIYILDPSEHCGYPLGEQTNLINELKETFDAVPFIIVENKSDLVTTESDHLKISAETEQGLAGLKEKMIILLEGDC